MSTPDADSEIQDSFAKLADRTLGESDGTAPRCLELSLSGGGSRAAAFALGVFLYLLESKKCNWVTQISSVSGGSLMNAAIATMWTDHGGPTEDLLQRYARRLAHLGIPLESYSRNFLKLALKALTVAVVSAVIALSALAVDFTSIAIAGGIATLVLLWYTGATLVAWTVSVDVFLEAWFKIAIDPTSPYDADSMVNSKRAGLGVLAILVWPTPRHTRRTVHWILEDLRVQKLSEVDSPALHVFCATDVRRGEHIYFSQGWTLSEGYGVSDTRDIRLDEVVKASAAFPAALPPVRISTERLAIRSDSLAGETHLTLVDGGVRDNLGHAFETYVTKQELATRRILTGYGSIRQILAVDASAPKGVADLSQGILSRLPIVRRIKRLTTFPRVLGILNQSNSEARSMALDAVLRESSRGFVISIQDSPVEQCVRVIDDVQASDSILGRASNVMELPAGQRRQRALVALQALVEDDRMAEASWNGDVARNSRITTTLDGIGADAVSQLVRHGFVLAMIESFIENDWPMLPVESWSKARFNDWGNE